MGAARAQLPCSPVLTAFSRQACINEWVKAAMMKTAAQGEYPLFCRRDRIEVVMVFLIWEGAVSCQESNERHWQRCRTASAVGAPSMTSTGHANRHLGRLACMYLQHACQPRFGGVAACNTHPCMPRRSTQ